MALKRILITAAGGPAGFCIIKSLKGRAYLIGLDGAKESPARSFCDELHIVPFASEPNYREALLQIISEVHPDIIVPTFDEDLLVFDSMREQLDCYVLLSPRETLEICNDKRRTALLFSDFAPRTFTIDEARELRPYPLFIRPAIGRGSKHGFIIKSHDDIEYALQRTVKPLIQELLQGPEITVDTFADFNGRLLGTAPRLRIQTRGGISTAGRFVVNEEIETKCHGIHKRIQFIGPANIQFMQDSRGAWRLLEINPRYSGGLALSLKAGYDSISPLLTLDPLKRSFHAYKITPSYNVTVVRYWEELIMND